MFPQAPSTVPGSAVPGGDAVFPGSRLAPEGPGKLLAELGRGLAGRPLEAPLAFRFCWRSLPFCAEVTAGGAAAPRLILTLAGDLGPLPFTAESHRARADLIVLARARTPAWGRAKAMPCRLVIDRYMHLSLRASLEVAPPLRAGSILAATVHGLIASRPLLDLVAEARRGKADGAVARTIAGAAG